MSPRPAEGQLVLQASSVPMTTWPGPGWRCRGAQTPLLPPGPSGFSCDRVICAGGMGLAKVTGGQGAAGPRDRQAALNSTWGGPSSVLPVSRLPWSSQEPPRGFLSFPSSGCGCQVPRRWPKVTEWVSEPWYVWHAVCQAGRVGPAPTGLIQEGLVGRVAAGAEPLPASPCGGRHLCQTPGTAVSAPRCAEPLTEDHEGLLGSCVNPDPSQLAQHSHCPRWGV